MVSLRKHQSDGNMIDPAISQGFKLLNSGPLLLLRSRDPLFIDLFIDILTKKYSNPFPSGDIVAFPGPFIFVTCWVFVDMRVLPPVTRAGRKQSVRFRLSPFLGPMGPLIFVVPGCVSLTAHVATHGKGRRLTA